MRVRNVLECGSYLSTQPSANNKAAMFTKERLISISDINGNFTIRLGATTSIYYLHLISAIDRFQRREPTVVGSIYS